MEDGRLATLKQPWKGYSRIRLVRQAGYKWIVEICGSGAQLEVYEDEFDLD